MISCNPIQHHISNYESQPKTCKAHETILFPQCYTPRKAKYIQNLNAGTLQYMNSQFLKNSGSY